jgi:type II secretory pathway predicted ATPase ExeA
MYEAFYKLKSKPFSLMPDTEFLYLGTKHQMALSLLEYGLLNQAGFTIITGEPGTGKTTLLHKILEQSQESFTIGVISNTHEALGSLIPWILMAFSQDGKGKDSVELFERFSLLLAAEEALKHRVLLMVDEAQNLTPAMLEELRLLSNTTSGRTPSLQIILSGQPRLRELLQRPDLAQFAQRVAVDYCLEPLAEDETMNYIRHRIRVAGGLTPILTDHACRLVFRLTGGVPRLINQIVDTALAYGFAEQQAWVTASLLKQAASDRGKTGILPLPEAQGHVGLAAEVDEDERRQIASFETPPQPHVEAEQAETTNAGERYERGLALRKAGLFKQAIGQFQEAAHHRAYALKAHAQIGLCYKSSGRYEDAVLAFRKALQSKAASSKEIVQILYVLGRTLESLGRIAETLEAYRWIRREDPGYRDVVHRIQQLSSHRQTVAGRRPAAQSWMGGMLKSWQNLLGASK